MTNDFAYLGDCGSNRLVGKLKAALLFSLISWQFAFADNIEDWDDAIFLKCSGNFSGAPMFSFSDDAYVAISREKESFAMAILAEELTIRESNWISGGLGVETYRYYSTSGNGMFCPSKGFVICPLSLNRRDLSVSAKIVERKMWEGDCVETMRDYAVDEVQAYFVKKSMKIYKELDERKI